MKKLYFSFLFLTLLIFCSLLGYGETASPLSEPAMALQPDGTALTDIQDVVVGDHTTLVLKKDGSVWGWGRNTHGELGHGVSLERMAMPVETSSGPLTHVTSLKYDGTTTIAVQEDGTVWNSAKDLPASIVMGTSGGASFPISHFREKHPSLPPDPETQQDVRASGATFLAGLGVGSSSSLIALKDLKNPLAVAKGNSVPFPKEPFLIGVVATGPFREPAMVIATAQITHPDEMNIEGVYFYLKSSNGICGPEGNEISIGSSASEPYECSLNTLFDNMGLPVGHYTVRAVALSTTYESVEAEVSFDVLPSYLYCRGFFGYLAYCSSIAALDLEEGIFLDNSRYGLDEFTGARKDQPESNFSKRYPLGYPWFLRVVSDAGPSGNPCYHLCVEGETHNISYLSVNSIPVVNGVPVGDAPPMVAFGKAGGGKELFVNQAYRFGIAAGGQRSELPNNPDIKIEAYDKADFTAGATNVRPVFTETYTLPRASNPQEWDSFNSQGFLKEYHLQQQVNGKNLDFETQVQYTPDLSAWGEAVNYSLVITHKAGNSDFYYKVSIMGSTHFAKDGGDLFNMAQQGNAPDYNLSYSLDFNDPAPWSATFLNETCFQGIPLPCAYQGKSVEELVHHSLPVSDTLPAPESIGYDLKQLNNSPEIKSHPELDSFVADCGNDPMVLANYVLNEIELTDAIGYNANHIVDDSSINPQGVSRDALGTYLEGQGSPAEQCALLIYLLRKAGYPAAYVFPEHNGMLMFDQQLSKLLQMQIRSAVVSSSGLEANLPELIPVNYPWVATYIDGKWVHLFPWLKDTSIVEGKDLWNYFPAGYQNGTQWLEKYLLNDPAIRSLSKKDNLGDLFIIYAQNKLAEAGLSLDEVGMKIFNQRHHYTNWEEFPRPWKTPLISEENIAQNLDVSQNSEALVPALRDIFDTLEITVFSDRQGEAPLAPGSKIIKTPLPNDPAIATGVMRMVDLHNRRILLHHQACGNGLFKMLLTLEAYDSTLGSTDIATYTFNTGPNPDPGNLRNRQEISTFLQTTGDASNDNNIDFNIIHLRHRQVQSLVEHAEAKNATEEDLNALRYPNQFPGINEGVKVEECRPLLKGDMAVLNLNYGRVTKKMQEFEVRKYWEYQQQVAAHPDAPINAEIATGQLLQVMGQSYYYKLSQFDNFINPLLKVHDVSTIAHGFTKLSPLRNADGTPVIMTVNGHDDIKLSYPNVDMSFRDVAAVSSSSMHLETGDVSLHKLDAMQLSIGNGSANEHCIINEFFGQKAAISTVKLLDIAQGWTPETGVASHPGSGIVRLTSSNYLSEAQVAYEGTAYGATQTRTLADWATTSGLWGAVSETLSDSTTGALSTIFITPVPIIAPGQEGQPFTGMGAMSLGIGEYGAYISGNMVVTHGGSGASISYNVPQDDPPASWVSGGSLNLTDDGAVYNNVEMSVENDSTPNYYDGNSSSSNLGNSNDQLSQGVVQLDPQEQSSLSNYGQLGGSTLSEEATEVDDVAGFVHDDDTSEVGDGSQGAPIFDNPSSPLVPSYTSYFNDTPVASFLPDKPAEAVATTGNEVAQLKEQEQNNGNTGGPVSYQILSNFIADPVSVITGEFYINALDLKLYGPMPLEMRRSYGSQNQANNNMGYGWKLNYFPYLMLSSDSVTKPSFIYAVETDGTVVCYRRQNAKTSGAVAWVPKTTDNPTLSNAATPGANHNLFNNRITQKTVDGVVVYTLVGADGNMRVFKTCSFPVVGSPSITRTRPYLDQWNDQQGNGYRFTYGCNEGAPDWGQLNGIISSNGNSLHFKYDTKGHIIEAFASDGRLLKYDYDGYGDLTQVTLPNASVISYRYEHKSTPSGKGEYSTHLLVQEKKPSGRILNNTYDESRRAVTQAATVGTSPIPTTNATFTYSVTGTNEDKTLNGITSVKDINGNTTSYAYTNSQLVQTTYSPNSSGITPRITQEWYADNSNGGYPRSLKSRTDRRGLITSWTYDRYGSILTQSMTGNLTGGSSSEVATTTFSYNKRNMLASATDALGGITTYAYNDASHPYNPTSIIKSNGGKTTSAQFLSYENSGGACGLLASLNNNGAITTYHYDNHGFLSSQAQETGTQDPAITTSYTTNYRGETTSSTDNLGRKTRYSYDPLGRTTGVEISDATGALVGWHFCYYNSNGDLMWEQGSRYNPVDYIYYEYDRSGHLLHKATWLSEATADGQGVRASGITDQAFRYDGYGNLLEVTDPNGTKTCMSYDPLGEMVSRVTGAASERLTYEPGGNIATHTTVLGGIESNTYTSTGLVQSSTLADGTTHSYRYDLLGRCAAETLPNGSTWTTEYNDADRTITRSFHDATGIQLATESQTLDARGNSIAQTDRLGNAWARTYDGLNRLTSEQDPTGALQTTSYPRLDEVENQNALGEKTVLFTDALGRIVQKSILNKDGGLAYQEQNLYALDHQSVTTTLGTGDHAISTTTKTDTLGHPVSVIHGDGFSQVMTYDWNGNKTSFTDEKKNTTRWTYDGLNHLTSETFPGGTVVNYSYNATGELLTRAMPRGLTETNSYNSAGQKISDGLLGINGEVTRNHTYSYEQGRVSSITDPRGFTTVLTYDAWQHPVAITSSGAAIAEQNQTTTYSYDPRGLLTSVAQNYNDPTTGPSTLVTRSYDANSHLTAETTTLNGELLSSWNQTWNAAQRRSGLHWNADERGQGAQYTFDQNALGLPTLTQNITGSYKHYYHDNGLLSGQGSPLNSVSMMRDERGRITEETIKHNGTLLSERMDWKFNNTLASYNLLSNTLGLSPESRTYSYDTQDHLIKEPYLLRGTTTPNALSDGTQTLYYAFDQEPLQTGNSQSSGLGVRTAAIIGTTAINEATQQTGQGQINQVSNLHVSGTSKLVNFSYDAMGEVYDRYFLDDHYNQALAWDSFQRLVNVLQDGDNTNYTWNTTYDGLGRRIQTRYTNKSDPSKSSLINYYYDPEVEFLELGHSINGARIWNLYGPDRSGTYGGAQGIGGLESTYLENSAFTYQTVSNYFGDIVGVVTDTYVAPYPGVVGGYGPLPGSDVNHDLLPQWRSHYLDDTGFYCMGARYYEPTSGRFLSADPLGHSASLSLYDYCNGDPVNGLDPDGRLGKGAEAGWSEGNGSFAGTYDSSQASSELSYGLGWTVGGAVGDVNAMIARPVAGLALDGAGLINWGMNTAEQTLGLPSGSIAAGSFTLGPEVGIPLTAIRGLGSGLETGVVLENITTIPLLTEGSQTPNAGGVIRSFVQEADKIYYRTFSENQQGSFLTAVKPGSSSFAREALALPPGNTANYIQEVLVPAGTRLQRSRARASFGQQGGAEQFELLNTIPNKNFSTGVSFQ